MSVISGVFETEEDFNIYQEWIKDNGYTYEDSFRDDLITKFTTVYYEKKKFDFNTLTANEIVDIIVGEAEKQLKEPLFNWNLVYIPQAIFLQSNIENNMKIYEYYRLSKIKCVFLIRNDQQELFTYIQNDILANKFNNEVYFYARKEDKFN